MQTIEEIVESPLSDKILHSMLRVTHAQIANSQTLGLEPKGLKKWALKLQTALSIRGAINDKRAKA